MHDFSLICWTTSLFTTFIGRIGSIHSGVWKSPTPSCRTLPSKHLWTCPQGWHGSFLVQPYCMTEGTWVGMRFVLVVPCRWFQSCFVAFIPMMRMAAFLMAIPVRTRSWNTWVGLRHPGIVHMALLMLTSTLTCGVLLQTVTRIQAAEKTRAWVENRNVITQPPQVVPVRHALMTASICNLGLYCIVLYNDVFTFLYVAVGNKLLLLLLICNLGRNFFVGCLKFNQVPTDVLCSFLKHWRLSTDTFSSRFASQQATGKTFPAYERLPATTSATNLHFWLAYLQLTNLHTLLSKLIGWTLYNGGVQQWGKLISTVQPCTRYTLQNFPTTGLYICRMQHKAMWVQETLTCM